MRTVGVEEELLVVDPVRWRPAPLGDEVVDAAAEPGSSEPVEHEFKQEQVEIASEPRRELDDLLADLVRSRAVAAASARSVGAEIAAIATNPGKLRPRPTQDERYLRMVEEFGLLAREQLTCGQHVHVSVCSRAEGVAILDRIRGWLPVLLALSANSPFWQQQDTGYASFRSVLWGRWPSAGPMPVYRDEAGYDAAVREQLSSGSALDDGMIYFDARLSARYPTVEIRVADVCTDVADAVLLAALARALADTAAASWRAGELPPQISTALLRGASWRAARWGMSGRLLDPHSGTPRPAWSVIETLLGLVEPALRACGDLDRVTGSLERIRRHGTGAERQRAVRASRRSLDAVLADAVTRTLAGGAR
jgi:carboxylate-amine ligase